MKINMNSNQNPKLEQKGKLPDFIVIGAPKCGTTTLIKNLALHPDLYVTDYANPGNVYGEVRFFDVNWRLGVDWYRSLFLTDKICGEKTPFYMGSRKTMQRLYSVIPDAKLLICLRDPVKRLISQVNMRRRIDSTDLKVFDILNNEAKFIKWGMYYSQIKENVLQYFDRNQVLILIVDEEDYTIEREEATTGETHGLMVKDSSGHIKKIMEIVFKFLDLPMIDDEFKFHYVGNYKKTGMVVTDQEIEAVRLIYQEHNEKLFNFIGRQIESWL